MRNRLLTAAAVVALTLTACTPPTPPRRPAPTDPSATPSRALVIGTTDTVTTLDPAVAVLPADQAMAYNLFQRLMTVEPETGKLVPDAAEDCSFRTPTVYECRLRKELAFHNGRPVTSADVRFSLLRALRLGVDGSSAGALTSVATIEAPKPDVVRLTLRWADTEIGYALTAPATSIVDSGSYDPDREQPDDKPVVGSGAYALGVVSGPTRGFVRYDGYRGAVGGQLDRVTLRTYPDSGAVEDAMAAGQVDVVWRGLSQAAEKRLADQTRQHEDGATDAGYRALTTPAAGVSVVRWDPRSPHRLDGRLRTAVAGALQEERTLSSLIPPTRRGHTPAFPLGGRPTPAPAPPPARITLTMAYDAGVAADDELARQVRDRLESTLGVGVRLVPEPATADLHVGPSGTWIAQPVGYLLTYLADPLPGSAAKLAQLEQRYRSVSDAGQRDVALGEIQKQAAADLTVLPVSADDQTLYLARGVELNEPTYGPGWQPLFAVVHR